MKHKFRNALILTSLCVGCLHVLNKCIIAASTVKNLLPMHPGKFFDWRYGRIFYRKSGAGSPLLLIHDLSPFSSSYDWNQLEDYLAKDYTVYSIDLLGCGRSDKPNITYTNYLYVQLISDFAEKIIKRKTSVAATGLSGSFAIMACYNNENLFDDIFLINPENLQNLKKIPDTKSRIAMALMNSPIIGTTIYHILTNRSTIEYNFTEKYYCNPFQVSSRLVDIYHECAHKINSSGKFLYSSIKANFVNISIENALKRIDNNVFIIGGSAVDQISSTIDSYVNLNPTIETAIIKGVKYLPQLEAPEKLYKTMKTFL